MSTEMWRPGTVAGWALVAVLVVGAGIAQAGQASHDSRAGTEPAGTTGTTVNYDEGPEGLHVQQRRARSITEAQAVVAP
ncbi:hypothetical protein [Kineosporia succinea]|uniref:Secreted protein n=1 Tax=Kineosporia succinea TaxID=84632 RepID=A0ABT9NYJ2_9ACTN|nr:hypothetical protein [Kineosporia succinea]MDP9825060.1 hypothetical protein [Kineosporia succinea]